ncbi:hypothetical protein ABZ725_37585 [Streptomyces sp. NPDC006872]|uniref:hypothetical protein n=1 Tax=Streptomyces sp. NPDC006872 TaxID=3155720 RepID=UPI0034082871
MGEVIDAARGFGDRFEAAADVGQDVAFVVSENADPADGEGVFAAVVRAPGHALDPASAIGDGDTLSGHPVRLGYALNPGELPGRRLLLKAEQVGCVGLLGARGRRTRERRHPHETRIAPLEKLVTHLLSVLS